MIICDCCVNDKLLAAVIQSAENATKGRCPTCGSIDRYLYDTDKQDDLVPYFENLLSIYSSEEELPDGYPEDEKHTLLDEMSGRWNIFSDISEKSQHDIITAICNKTLMITPTLLHGIVGIPELCDKSYLKEHSMLKNRSWEQFSKELKTINRYHSRIINGEVLEQYCSFVRKVFKAGACFCRARISDKDGYSANHMSAPPEGKSSEGRANARGITCLYVASDVETTLHEVRAGAFDYVSVGLFQLKKDITIVDLNAIKEISPFTEGINFVDHAINKTYLERIDQEMSRPLRRSDSTLDYVPTQYIVDFVKSLEHKGQQEYDGIKYNSTTNPGGFNLAIFNPDLFECISVDIFEIEKLSYGIRQIN